jgi:hypothetical protein
MNPPTKAKYFPILMVVIAVLGLSTTAHADDEASAFVTKLFMHVCIPNVGNDDNVRAWAREKKLAEVTSPPVLQVFVGEGGGGAAWAVPAGAGSFALAIRGQTHACAVYARTASPPEVEAYFKQILEGVKRPGLEVRVVTDSSLPGATGTIHTLVYSVSAAGVTDRGNLYTMQTSEKSGGPFQATLQAAKYNNAR